MASALRAALLRSAARPTAPAWGAPPPAPRGTPAACAACASLRYLPAYASRRRLRSFVAPIIAARVATVFLSFDPDRAGDGAAEATAGLLLSRGVEVRRIRFPAGHDANSYALAVTPPRQALAVLLNAAEWLGKGAAGGKGAVSPSLAASSAPAPSFFSC